MGEPRKGGLLEKGANKEEGMRDGGGGELLQDLTSKTGLIRKGSLIKMGDGLFQNLTSELGVYKRELGGLINIRAGVITKSDF